MKQIVWIGAAVMLVAGCQGPDVIRVGEAEGVVYFGDAAAKIVRPCSREDPQPADKYWKPTLNDIQAFEEQLPSYLMSNPPPADAGALQELSKYRRQYVGIVRGGRRSIYASFVIYDPTATADWDREPVIVCDGGAQFFGAEFDMSTQEFTHIAYNGVG